MAVNNTELRDKPRTTREGCLGPGTQPGAARSEGSKWLEAQAHLHTTLNKSRDEKLDLVRVCQSYESGKRAMVMAPEILTIVAQAGSLRGRQKGASTWARTRDLSVNSRALCQLSHGGIDDVASGRWGFRDRRGAPQGAHQKSFCRDLNPDRWIQSPE